MIGTTENWGGFSRVGHQFESESLAHTCTVKGLTTIITKCQTKAKICVVHGGGGVCVEILISSLMVRAEIPAQVFFLSREEINGPAL